MRWCVPELLPPAREYLGRFFVGYGAIDTYEQAGTRFAAGRPANDRGEKELASFDANLVKPLQR